MHNSKIYAIENSLGYNYPELAKEWHPTKNEITAFEITQKNDRSVWWQCAEGHEWETKVRSRSSNETGCPQCVTLTITITEKNSILTHAPELIEEWHPTKNGSMTVYNTAKGSHKKAWFVCKVCRHEWKAVVQSRVQSKRGCPRCRESRGEKFIRNFLIENNIEFECEYPILINEITRRYDFYIPEEKLFVEVHGLQHFETVAIFSNYTLKERQEIDKQKREYAEANGKYIMVDYREHDPEVGFRKIY